MQFGKDKDSQFNGEIYGYEEEDPAEHSDGIYLVPSEALSELSIETLTVIKYASIIITDDSSCDFDQFMQSLKACILKGTPEDALYWKPCPLTRFIVLDSAASVEKLSKLMMPGSTEKNTDLTDRGYLLSKILKHMDASIWEKVTKDDFIEKFANIDAEHSYQQTMQESTKILAEAIEKEFSEEESPMKQIAMGEIFEKI